MLKKESKKAIATILLGSTLAFGPFASAYAAPVKVEWDPSKVTITNNVGKADTVKIEDLVEGAIVKIYDKATGGKLLGTTTVAKGKTEALISIPNLGEAEGKIFVSVTMESPTAEIAFGAEAASTKPGADDITVLNNVGKPDTVTVKAAEGSVVKVYDAATAGKVLGTVTVAKGKTEAAISVAQLGADAGKVYVTVTEAGKKESERTEKAFDAEAASTKLGADDITVLNNVGKADTVTVKATEGSVVKVYDAATAGKVLGTVTVAKGKTEAAISVAQLGADAGKVYVTVTEAGKKESERTEKAFDAEAASTKPGADDITVLNNVGKADTVTVKAAEGSVVKVYDAATAGKVLGTVTVAKGKTEGAISVAQLGADAGKVYVTVTEAGKKESERTEKAFDAEAASTKLGADDITVLNNVGKADTVTVKAAEGSVVKVYDAATAGKVLGTVTVAKGKTEAAISVAQLGADAGKVYVTVTEAGKKESERTEKAFDAEAASTKPGADDITVLNNVGKADTVTVKAAEGSVVKVYDAATAGKVLGTVTVAKGKTEGAISVAQLGADAGKVYVTVTEAGKKESERTEKAFDAEAASTKLGADDITVLNNVGKADTVTVKAAEGSVVKVYDAATAGKVLGTVTVAKGKTEAAISVAQLGADAGKVYVTVTEAGKKESERTEKAFDAEASSTKPGADDITVLNNVGKADTVTVKAAEGSVVKVYDAATAGKVLGTVTVAKGKTEAAISVAQLGADAGKVYVTVTEAGKKESERTEKAFDAEASSTKPGADDITVLNNVGKADTVTVKAAEGSVVKVYDAATAGKVLGTVTVAKGKTEAAISVAQLGADAGKVYVTVTEAGKKESERTEKAFDAEASSTKPGADDITVLNNVGKADTVTVKAAEGSVVKVYDAATAGKVLGTVTVAKGKTEAAISVAQLGADAGKVYVTVTEAGKKESERTEKAFDAEASSTKPGADDITVLNNVGKADTVTVKAAEGSVVKVYDAATAGKVLGTVTVAKGKTEAAISVAQLGADAGKVYVTVTEAGKKESERTEKAFDAEASSTKPGADDITVLNNVGKADTVTVKAAEGSVVKVYDAATAGKVLGTVTVAKGKTEAAISVAQLGADAGKVYVTVTEAGKKESERTEKAFDAEASSTKPGADDITVLNNVGKADTVTVKAAEGSVVKVYDAATAGKVLGTVTVAKGKTEAAISVAQLGADAGKVYVTVTEAGKKESERTEKAFDAEAASTKPGADDITVLNNVGKADTVTVKAAEGSVVKVYDAETAGKVLGTVTVAAGKTEAVVSVPQLGGEAGKVYVTVTEAGKKESERMEKAFDAEAASTKPGADDITVLNNVGKADTVTVKAAEGAIVKVYDAATAGKMLGTVTVAKGKTEAAISVAQLGAEAGKVYVTVTEAGKKESERTEKAFDAEAATTAPKADEITVVNNAGKADTVTVTAAEGTIVKVYDAATAGKVLGTVTVAKGKTEAVITVAQLGGNAGTVYVSATEAGKQESSRTEKGYEGEGATTAPKADDITVLNNVGKADTVTVKATEGSVVKVYDAATAGKVLGTATVAAGKSEAAISVAQLGAEAGKVYVTVTESGKKESERTDKAFDAEAVTTAPKADEITVVNNAGKADTVTVTAAEGTIVKVYDAATAGKVLGTVTVAKGKTEAVITVAQLGGNAGTVYVSATEAGKQESSRTEKGYEGEGATTAPKSDEIEIVNNVGKADTVTIKAAEGSVVKVYDAATAGKMLGTAKVAAGKTEVTVNITQLGGEAGSVYVTVTETGKLESERIEKAFEAEAVATTPKAGDITISNNAGKADTVTVTAEEGTIVKVYDAATDGKLLGYATVAKGNSEVTVSISQLGSEAGSVFISLTEAGKKESERLEKSYAAEEVTKAPAVDDIVIANNAGKADTITVKNLSSGDIVKAYKEGTTTVLGTVTVSDGGSEAIIRVTQLGVDAGAVEITVQNPGKVVSEKVTKAFDAEQ
ncbi:hypothetical protein E8L90_26130 [Brevibacillus antibioticus]|uniref:Uncharacterized protein n=1 Tax=Brevibacillus antibioticus TaxID=2570228 RepID=A0A4U2YCM4_9BACL|nr:hypothetical protein [Brevibacillus antibioticus]TKI58597.1 hypothetical protein E8L90_26130 [Brevibacillus antibioticus]